MATNENNPTILVPVHRTGTSIDIERFKRDAEDLANKYAEDDKAATSAVVQVTDSILSNKKYESMTSFTASTLAKMALGVMQEVPTDKLCAETEVRVKSYLASQPEKFLQINRGRNAGFHVRERLKKEDLEKLQKEADSQAAKTAAAQE